MLRELEYLPEGLLGCPAPELEQVLGAPTLIHLPGRRSPPLFVSILMHGNETTGWEAVRRLLARYRPGGGEHELPRALSLFIGNVSAASQGLRRLPGQPDYNRVWPGGDDTISAEAHLMQQVVDVMAERGIFASVDVHNNTGLNPHYACINSLDSPFLHLAALFGRTVVYFTRPTGVQSLAMAQLAPAVTLECGKPDQPFGMQHVMEYLEACLQLSRHPDHPLTTREMDLFHTVATVKVPEAVSFGFDSPDSDISLAGDLELLNFRELSRGTLLGRVRSGLGVGLSVVDDQGADVSGRYLEAEAGELRLRLPVMPSMLTRDCRVIRQDCLCYLMERYGDHLS
ncbi:MAG: M14 family metallopeptidase [Sedimenticola sp.]|nr:M14 family metallopeptidase [Sedimenticola sp.]